MVKLLCLFAWVAFLFGQVHSCSLGSAQIDAVFKRPEDIWQIRVGWSSDNPDCTLKLEEEVPGQPTFKVMDTQMCTSGRYCYFKTSRQSCVDGKPQYTFMKLTSMCSECNIATFTFIIGGLVNKKGVTTICNRIIYPGKTYARAASHLTFSECGQNRTCFGVGKNVGPGCYCEDGYVLNATTGLCVEKSVCPEINPKIPLNLKTPDCVKLGESVEVAWEVNAERMYTYTIRSGGVVRKTETLSGQTDLSKGFTVVGKIGTLTIPSNGLGPGQYSFEVEDISSDEKNVETGNFSIKVGCKSERELNINVNPYCDTKGIQITEITWDVVSDRSYRYKIIDTSDNSVVEQGQGAGTGGGDFTVSGGRALVKVTLGAGNYRVTVEDLDAGVQNFYQESKDFSIEECKQPHPFNLMVPSCVRSSESSIQISWTVMSDRSYSYKIKVGNLNFAKTVSGARSMGTFVVSGGRGTLTITTQGEWPIGVFKVTVNDLSSSIPSMKTASFKIKKGCKPIEPLNIDARGICVGGESTGRISWSVQADRTYKYTVSRGGKVVQAATVPGSGSASFPVSNGRGQVSLKLEPGDYTVTVQDLDAGVNTFYSESKDFSVAACELEIRTNTCVESGQNVEFTLDATAGRTYRYAILVEGKTSQVVKSGSVGASQGGNKYVLASTNTLPVGRYILMITEVETGGEGYDRFLVTASGDIGSEVRYTANGEHSGMYICLDPIQGGSFAGGLTAKVGSAAESSLTGQGKCHLQPYTGSESTLTISVRKNGGTADQVTIRYRG